MIAPVLAFLVAFACASPMKIPEEVGLDPRRPTVIREGLKTLLLDELGSLVMEYDGAIEVLRVPIFSWDLIEVTRRGLVYKLPGESSLRILDDHSDREFGLLEDGELLLDVSLSEMGCYGMSHVEPPIDVHRFGSHYRLKHSSGYLDGYRISSALVSADGERLLVVTRYPWMVSHWDTPFYAALVVVSLFFLAMSIAEESNIWESVLPFAVLLAFFVVRFARVRGMIIRRSTLCARHIRSEAELMTIAEMPNFGYDRPKKSFKYSAFLLRPLRRYFCEDVELLLRQGESDAFQILRRTNSRLEDSFLYDGPVEGTVYVQTSAGGTAWMIADYTPILDGADEWDLHVNRNQSLSFHRLE